MKDLYGKSPNLYKHLSIVRTKSVRQYIDFENNKKAAENYNNKNSLYNMINDYFSAENKKIPQFFIDSVTWIN